MATDHNARPTDLTLAGNLAWEAVMKVLREHNATETGGCKTFYSPAEWKRRGEEYGTNSVLIVVYDSGEVGCFFNLDRDNGEYTFTTAMQKALKKAGFYYEECTSWYAAVYKK